MTRLCWLTDIHLNFLRDGEVAALLDRVHAASPQVVLVSGDISEWPQLLGYLRQIDERLAAPVYFVLGNHDYYFSSIAEVRRQVVEFCRSARHCQWLVTAGVVELSPRLGLIGHDGWADGRLGDYAGSLVMLNDYRLIRELAGYTRQQRWPVLQQLGDEAADHFRKWLPAALARYQEILAVTHVPPFREACWYQGQISDDQWAPHFTCQAVGQVLMEIMSEHPQQRLTVLCGHTHGSGEAQVLPNLWVITGGADYGVPAITGIYELSPDGGWPRD